jgi:hypothetical protein
MSPIIAESVDIEIPAWIPIAVVGLTAAVVLLSVVLFVVYVRRKQ